MSKEEKFDSNRDALVDFFVANPEASVDAALKAAVRERRAQGLTMGLASKLKQAAVQVREERDRVAAERKTAEEAARVAARVCARCGSKEHWASECTVVMLPGNPVLTVRESPNEGVYKAPPEDDPDDESSWLPAVRHVLGKLAAGEIMSATDAYTYGGKLASRDFWRALLERFTAHGYLEQAKGNAKTGPAATILWAVRTIEAPALLDLVQSMDDEELASLVWPVGGQSAPQHQKEVASAAPPLANGSTAYVVQLVEAQLKLQQALLEGMQLLREEVQELKRRLQ